MKKVNADTLLEAAVAVAFFVFLGVIIWLAYGLGLPTGGDELMGRVR